MARFMYLYRGPATPLTGLSEEQAAARTAAFRAWMDKAGDALVDVGSPFGSGTCVRDDGTRESAGDLTGYTIVEADDLPSAAALTSGLPFLADGDGRHVVEIFELQQM